MPQGKYKSRTFRKVFVKVPGGKTKIHHKRRKPAKAKCANCGILLKGVPRELPYKMKGLPKTKKRPQRPYGGVLCSKCTKQKLKEIIRK